MKPEALTANPILAKNKTEAKSRSSENVFSSITDGTKTLTEGDLITLPESITGGYKSNELKTAPTTIGKIIVMPGGEETTIQVVTHLSGSPVIRTFSAQDEIFGLNPEKIRAMGKLETNSDPVANELVAVERIIKNNSGFTEKTEQLENLEAELSLKEQQIREEIAQLEKELFSVMTPAEKDKQVRKMRKEAFDLLQKGVDRIVIHGGTIPYSSDSEVSNAIHGENKPYKKNELVNIVQPDTDVRGALYLLNLTTPKGEQLVTYNEGSFTESVPKGSKKLESVKDGDIIVHIDTGGERFWVESNGKITEISIDHHNSEKDHPTSATQIMAEILSTSPKFRTILKEKPWLEKFIRFTTNIDNLSYIDQKWENGLNKFNKNTFERIWPKSLYALAGKEKFPFADLVKAFEEGRDPLNPFTPEETTPEIVKIIEDNKKAAAFGLKGVSLAQEATKKEGFPEETPELGKIVYHNFAQIPDPKRPSKTFTNKIANGIGFIATKASGSDTYIVFNKAKNNFFINSTTHDLRPVFERLNKLYPGTTLVRGVMLFAPKDEKAVANINEDEFLQAVGMKK